jgi:hypothetical protein
MIWHHLAVSIAACRLRDGVLNASLPQKSEVPRMRYALTMVALLVAAAPAQAEPRSVYVTLVLEAFAAKVECPGTDLVYQDLVQKAQDMQMPDGTTEKVRKAIAFLHTGGRMGERADDELMAEVAVATQVTDHDQRRLGMTTWCEDQKKRLTGFIRSSTAAAPTGNAPNAAPHTTP